MSGLLVPGKYIKQRPAEAFFNPDEERAKLMARFPDLASIQIFGPRVLVAKFIRDKLSANLAVAKNTQTEDKWQGKVGLVLAMGHLAFKSDGENNFGPDKVSVGDWVLYEYGDGADADYQPAGSFDKVPCKFINDVQITGKVTRPDIFY